ncbi:unnamed protein product [Chondrus crispus]|uniref:Cytochrome b561 domain-containing protein n=1 Tax=Chondrus crispus TaxID=2769 RepID=R7Q827_CHOCR|nr:unnamed protein product [Chondrus crispus]CDF34702.1 unnamed protein product [Chondrus crispus]|eukprot:XP_005714521.1 unnamed protein product [Chondrus crispus]
MIRYTRPLKGNDKEFDRPIRLTGPTFVLWAMGPLNPSLKRPIFDREQTSLPSSNVAVEFGRIVTNACERRLKVSENTVGSSIPGFKRPTISGVTDITARIGPSGGARGVEGITGGPSRGFAWYISPTGTSGMDVLIPAIGVERGRTYTFTVQGGTDDGSGNVFHPLYITTDSVGGFQTKSPQERRKETVYAGIQEVKTEADGAIIEFNAPAAGALCRITSTVSDTATVRFWADYHDTLDTSCTEDDAVTSNSGKLRWTVPADAPDLLYYQSVTLPFIGYKIGVFDEGEVDKGVLEEINGGGPLEIREEVVEESPSEGENEEEAVPTMEGNVDDGPLDALPNPSPQSNADDEPAATSESDATPTSEGEGPDAEGDVDGTVSEEDNDCQVNFKGTVRSYTLCKKDPERKGMDVYWNLREEDSELETLFRARKVEGGGYVAFGWGEVKMLNSHVVIANTNTESGIIDSYFLADSNSEGVNANSSLPLLSKDVDVKGDFVSGIFTRKLDIEGVSTLTSGATSIIWAIGPEPRPPIILEKHNLIGTDILEISGSAGSPDSVGDGTTTVADGNSNCSVSFNDTDEVFEGCRKGLTHNVEVYWTIREEDGEIDTLFRSQTDGYIGFGWGSSKMIGANAVIAMQDEKGDLKIEDYGMKAYSTAGVQPENNQELIDKRVAFDGEYLAGMFTRRLAVEGLPVITKGETDAIWAVGVRPSSKAQLKEHSKKSRGRIDLAESSGGVLGVDTSTYFIVHGVLMTMAWFVLTPSALVIMRFLKAHNPSTFRWHRALNLLSVSFVVAAFIMGLVRGTRKHRAHLIIGGIVFSLATLQALSGLLRPGKDKDGRQLWAVVHFLSGYVTLGLGMANVWLGLGVIGAATGYYIVCGVLVGFYVIAQLVFGLQAEKYPVRECEAEEAFPPDVDPLLAGEAPGPDLT